MQKQSSTRNNETGTAASHRKVRIVLPPMPSRQLCLTDRKVRAAARALELAFWQVSGGDFLISSLAADVNGLREASRL